MPDARPWVAPPGAWRKTRSAISLRMAISIVLFFGAIALPRIGREPWVAIAGVSMLAAAALLWPWRLPRTPFKAGLLAVQAGGEYEHALKRWQQEGALAVFQKQFNRLKKARTHLRNPQKEWERLQAELPKRGEARQLHAYLSHFPIAEAEIPEINEERKAALAARGIATAADVERDKVRQVYGFGPEMAARIMLWRQGLELDFAADPGVPVDPRDMRAIEEEYDVWLKGLTEEFARGPATLRWVSEEITRVRPRLLADLERTWSAYQMALLARG